jgi:hypothetical protein
VSLERWICLSAALLPTWHHVLQYWAWLLLIVVAIMHGVRLPHACVCHLRASHLCCCLHMMAAAVRGCTGQDSERVLIAVVEGWDKEHGGSGWMYNKHLAREHNLNVCDI